jgi:riboflavin biosynthesis pyrimidine reductase
MLNMIATADGAAALDGLSGGLGGEADRLLFRALRALPDAIMVAGGTARAERYGPSRPSAEVRAARRARGQDEVPPIAVISGSVSLDFDAPFFTEAEARPIILTHEEADPERVRSASEVADVIACGTDAVDLRAAMGSLHALGCRLLLLEGGPTLNGAMLAADLVDELHLSLAPSLAGGDAPRIARGRPLDAPRGLELAQVLEQDGFLFLRYVRA